MKNIGITVIGVGILVTVLGLGGIIGHGANFRTVMVGAVVLLALGFLVYRRGQGGRAN